MFGHFEKPVFLTLCKHTEILTLPAGAFLFKIGKQHSQCNSCILIMHIVFMKYISSNITGDPDENVYVVQSGCLNVFITESNGTMISLKFVKAGESVTSLLSFTDVLTVRKQFCTY